MSVPGEAGASSVVGLVGLGSHPSAQGADVSAGGVSEVAAGEVAGLASGEVEGLVSGEVEGLVSGEVAGLVSGVSAGVTSGLVEGASGLLSGLGETPGCTELCWGSEQQATTITSCALYMWKEDKDGVQCSIKSAQSLGWLIQSAMAHKPRARAGMQEGNTQAESEGSHTWALSWRICRR